MLDGATSRGLELYLKADTGGRITWWASYALAQVREDVTAFEVDKVVVPYLDDMPGTFDQRHTAYLDMNFRPGPKWHLNLAWQYRSGWPFSEEELRQEVTGDGRIACFTQVLEPNGGAYPAFHRLDARISRYFQTKKGRFTTYLELVNLYNHGNVRTYEFEIHRLESGTCRLHRQPDYWFRLLPSIGIKWSAEL